jgi:hypothetical protein
MNRLRFYLDRHILAIGFTFLVAALTLGFLRLQQRYGKGVRQKGPHYSVARIVAAALFVLMTWHLSMTVAANLFCN